ncbi:type II toxin-antitoxin system VapC family toxin [Sphingomonas sp.]|uniref:type II toxin-antitoxin system VapC family toxin n=1 Tax=Sphingomonas sp. TaxID=28214 RepID=UPI0035666453
MTLVVDASVAVKWFVREEGTDAARALLAMPDPLIAPDWLLIEAASTFWKKVKRSELLTVHAQNHLSVLPGFFQQLVPAAELVAEAFRLSVRLKHPIYDCLYLALAIDEGFTLVTADRAFYDAAANAGMADRLKELT